MYQNRRSLYGVLGIELIALLAIILFFLAVAV
jgi:hypothetical protein